MQTNFEFLKKLPPIDPNKSKGRIAESIASMGDVTVGSDVETLFMNQNPSENRPSFFPADNLFVKRGIYGTDGRTQQAEWRYTPCADIRTFKDVVLTSMRLCKQYINVRGVSNNFGDSLENVKPYGMGIYPLLRDHEIVLPESIGLHIHLGYTQGNFSQAQRGRIVRQIVAAFDVFLAPVVKIMEPLVGYHIRTGCGFYGDMSDFEDKPYGMEYKTLPSCIDDPEVFVGTFALAKALAFEVIMGNITPEVLKGFRVKKDLLSDEGYLRVLTKQSLFFTRRMCDFYYFYKQEIDAFFEKALSKNPKALFSTHEDIFSRWGVVDELPEEEEILGHMKKGTVLSPSRPIYGYQGNKEIDGTLPSKANILRPFSITVSPF